MKRYFHHINTKLDQDVQFSSIRLSQSDNFYTESMPCFDISMHYQVTVFKTQMNKNKRFEDHHLKYIIDDSLYLIER